MLKKLLIAVMIAAPSCLFAQKIGSVNTQEVFALMPEVKSADASLQEVQKKYETEFQALQDEFNKKLKEYQELAKDTPDSIKQRREQELNELGKKIENFQQTASQDLQTQNQKLLQPIQEKLLTAIKAVGEENGYDYILDSGSMIFVGKNASDLTTLVKNKLGLKDAPAAK